MMELPLDDDWAATALRPRRLFSFLMDLAVERVRRCGRGPTTERRSLSHGLSVVESVDSWSDGTYAANGPLPCGDLILQQWSLWCLAFRALSVPLALPARSKQQDRVSAGTLLVHGERSWRRPCAIYAHGAVPFRVLVQVEGFRSGQAKESLQEVKARPASRDRFAREVRVWWGMWWGVWMKRGGVR